MYRLLETMDRLQISGFTLLEWFGVAAVLLLILLVLLKLLNRVFKGTFAGHAPRSPGVSARPQPATRKEKILVVDDDPLVLEMMQRLLGELGYFVVGVNSGASAVEYMRNNGADLLLIDLVLGKGMDGVETYRRIRETRPFQRVIVVSGYANPEKVADIRRLGVEHYLIKPVPLATLAQAIRSELDRP
jgi:CheY-like chemotaxis protein